MRKLFLVIFLVFFLSGCGIFHQGYRHPVTGVEVECRVMGWGLVGFPLAVLGFRDCRDRYERAGYIPVGEGK